MYSFSSEAEGISNPSVTIIVVQFHTHQWWFRFPHSYLLTSMGFTLAWTFQHGLGMTPGVTAWHCTKKSQSHVAKLQEELGILEFQCCSRKSVPWKVRPQMPEKSARFWMAHSRWGVMAIWERHLWELLFCSSLVPPRSKVAAIARSPGLVCGWDTPEQLIGGILPFKEAASCGPCDIPTRRITLELSPTFHQWLLILKASSLLSLAWISRCNSHSCLPAMVTGGAIFIVISVFHLLKSGGAEPSGAMFWMCRSPCSSAGTSEACIVLSLSVIITANTETSTLTVFSEVWQNLKGQNLDPNTLKCLKVNFTLNFFKIIFGENFFFLCNIVRWSLQNLLPYFLC